MKKILIIGGCGYLGARIAEYLASSDYQISILNRSRPAGYEKWSSLMNDFILGDIQDERVIEIIKDRNFEIIINLVSLDHHQSNENPNLVSSINVMPTWNILEKLSNNGLKKFIYFSTIHVYGKIPNQLISEDYPLSPINTYGLTHLLSENICNYFNHKTNIECINIRLSNSYGSPVFKENNCWWLVINDFCKSAFNFKKINLNSDGSPQRDFIHSFDICSAIKLIIETNLKDNIFNIASGKTFTILELAHIVKKTYEDQYQKTININFLDGSSTTNQNEHKNIKKYNIDISRIKKYGFKPKIDLTTGINTIFKYLDKNN